MRFMHTYWCSLFVAAAMLIAGTAWAQEQAPKGWLGADLQDVGKEEADKLGWDAPRGAKVRASSPGSPADKAGLKSGDIIVAVDRIQIDTASEVIAAIEAKRPGVEVQLSVLSGGRERRVTATLAERPRARAADATAVPHLMLDTGGHMATVTGIAFTPDGKQIVSASIDKTVRVWDVETGKTVRMIRGEAASGDWGRIDAIALSPDGRWLAAGGKLHGTDRAIANAIRLYDFASGKLDTLLKGHEDVVSALAFSSDGTRLISGSADKTAIIWDLANRQQVLRLSGHLGVVAAVSFSADGVRAVTGSGDATLRLWSAADAKLIAEMTEHKKLLPDNWVGGGGVASLAVSPDDHLIASGSTDGQNPLVGRPNGKARAPVRRAVRDAKFGRRNVAALQPRWALAAFNPAKPRLPGL